ncbi:MAG: MBL fold metallo-hydrolase [Candidatus Lokiarchaeota archaeon]|nr:MBL fold metallo-hydrolase [Candidatus Lokiarchaeota archaeon]
MRIQFIGAAQTVTGSMHLIEANGFKFLLDCGLYQGKRKVAFELNRNFDLFEPRELDFIILSHAHIDHSGNLPTIYKKGFNKPIYSTFATKDLCEIMLLDSAHIQEKDVMYVNKKRGKQGKNLFEPLYQLKDAQGVLKNFVGVNYLDEKEIAPGIKLTFFNAGHILGSAITFLTVNENGRVINLGFTGDLGRPNMPIITDPEKMFDVDYLICESTYGGRKHGEFVDNELKLTQLVNKIYSKKSKMIIPAFSVERTQDIIVTLHKLFDENKSYKIPIYVDSPLSVNATRIFREHPECFDNETAKYLIENEDPFGFSQINYITDVADSKELNNTRGPLIIISSSGMCEAGRILHHLANNVEEPNNIILFVGYQAMNTLGRKMKEGTEIIKIFGEEFKLNAEIVELDAFSAHADSDELLSYLNQLDKDRLNEIFLVHGELEQQNTLKEELLINGFKKISIPKRGDVFEI